MRYLFGCFIDVLFFFILGKLLGMATLGLLVEIQAYNLVKTYVLHFGKCYTDFFLCFLQFQVFGKFL